MIYSLLAVFLPLRVPMYRDEAISLSLLAGFFQNTYISRPDPIIFLGMQAGIQSLSVVAKHLSDTVAIYL
jgi:hypothetical protein